MVETLMRTDPEKRPSGDRAYYAHTQPNSSSEHWQELSEHLYAVANGARKRAERFGAEDWGYLAGLWHDVGKYSDAFQNYLRESGDPDSHLAEMGVRGRVDHSTAGAQHAVKEFPVLGHLLAYCIAGHHAGLADIVDPNGGASGLRHRLQKELQPWQHGLDELAAGPAELSAPRQFEEPSKAKVAFGLSLFVRMLFSCLCDADFLDTEAFMTPERAAERPAHPPDILARMAACLDSYVGRFDSSSRVNAKRSEVYRACLTAAAKEPGLFSLTVPTGGGKTLSSLAFALRHAIAHQLDRVIYVIPFTSIVEQNADVFRMVMEPLGENIILEHHSNADPDKETVRSRLSTENWDAPLIVTTNVQFFDSLFASRTSRCRKLHALARSVVILDEAQALPPRLLKPCLRVLEELAARFRTTVVLCTATQPAIHKRDDFAAGLTGVREIIPRPDGLYRSLKRVDTKTLGSLADVELVERILKHDQVLCIVNTRGHARNLFEQLGEAEENVHLSASMCPEHRTKTLNRVHARLDAGESVRLVSTQLIEAGVDVDFPVVYRSMAGIDSIAQAAGRCNRNGRQAIGTVYVFEPENQRSEAFLRSQIQDARQIAALHDDLLSLDAVEHYFKLHYWNRSTLDEPGVLDCFRLDGTSQDAPFLFNFREASRRFRLIDDAGETVLVPWGEEGRGLIEQLRGLEAPWPRRLLRRLQRFGVQVRERAMRQHIHAFERLHDRFWVLACPEIHYSQEFGLNLEGAALGFLEA